MGNIKRTHLTRWRPWLLIVAFGLTSTGLLAQRGQRGNLAERLSDYLELDEEQVAAVQGAIDRAQAPGMLWEVASVLNETLTEQQRIKLKALPDARRLQGRPGVDGRGWRRARSGAPGWGIPSEYREAIDETRAKALSLSEQQIESLESWRERAEKRRPLGGLPPDVAETLTEEQREIAEIHDALAIGLRAGGRGWGPGRGQGRGARFRGPRRGG